MANKNTKPYQNTKQRNGKGRNRNYAISKKLENTMRIRIDLDRINDEKTLDTSFLEGRKYDKKEKSSKKIEKPIKQEEKKVPVKKKEEPIKKVETPKKENSPSSQNSRFYLILIILGIVSIVLTLFYREFFRKPSKESSPISLLEEVQLDENYLFVGDSHTQKFPFDTFDLDYHYVKIGEEELTTQMVLEDPYHYIYQYNPSDVILQIGLYDLLEGEDISDVVENIEKIVIGITQNRKYSHIYVQSLYPMDSNNPDFDVRKYRNIDSDIIKELNQKLETLCKKLEVSYIDIYSLLAKGDSLEETYSEDGEELNEEAYQEVLSLIQQELHISKK